MKKSFSTYARLLLLVLVLTIGVLTLAGCGSGSPGRYGAPPPTQPTTPPNSIPGY